MLLWIYGILWKCWLRDVLLVLLLLMLQVQSCWGWCLGAIHCGAQAGSPELWRTGRQMEEEKVARMGEKRVGRSKMGEGREEGRLEWGVLAPAPVFVWVLMCESQAL